MLEKLAGKNIIVFDCEIQNEIDGKKITWNDHNKMGLSVGVIFDYLTGDYKVYLENDLQEMCDRINKSDLAVAFNQKGFDNKLLRGCGGDLKPDSELKLFDMLEQSRKATGWDEGKTFPKGLRLDDHLLGTFGADFMKTEDGAEAPKLWQAGKHGRVISYCISDVRREKALFEQIVSKGFVCTATHGIKYVDLSLVNRALGD